MADDLATLDGALRIVAPDLDIPGIAGLEGNRYILGEFVEKSAAPPNVHDMWGPQKRAINLLD